MRSDVGERVKKHFSGCANTLTALYQEASRAYLHGVQDARTEIQNFVLEELEPVPSSSSAINYERHTATNNIQSCSRHPRPRLVARLHEHNTSTSNSALAEEEYRPSFSSRQRRYIDADLLLQFLSTGGQLSSAVGPLSGSSGSGGGDVPHTFGRRRMREEMENDDEATVIGAELGDAMNPTRGSH